MESIDDRTLRMLLGSPDGCIFICATELEAIALRELAKKHERRDVEIHSTAIILPGKLYAGAGWPRQVLVDARIKLTPAQEAVLRDHRNLVNSYRPPMGEGAK